jgi:hypothetical protein
MMALPEAHQKRYLRYFRLEKEHEMRLYQLEQMFIDNGLKKVWLKAWN